MTERTSLIALFERLGATPAQAPTLADQLLKRSEQQARERGISQTEALARLLDLAVQGRAGTPPPGFEGVSPAHRADKPPSNPSAPGING